LALRDQIERSKDNIKEIFQLELQTIIVEFTPQLDVLKMRYSKLIEN
jgi:hypothetical protein